MLQCVLSSIDCLRRPISRWQRADSKTPFEKSG